MARKLISFDWAIKKLLRSKANFGILEGFLSELLFTDIKVEDAQGQLILIEVQYSREQDYLFRILFSAAKCLTEHMDKGAAISDKTHYQKTKQSVITMIEMGMNLADIAKITQLSLEKIEKIKQQLIRDNELD